MVDPVKHVDATDAISDIGSAPIDGCILRVASGEPQDLGRTIELQRGTARVGQSSHCELVVQDSAVSREHVEFALLPTGISMRDLGSTNGTFYLGQRIENAVLSPGARITIGRTEIVLLPTVPEESDESPLSSYGELIGTSQLMRRLYARLQRLEGVNVSVLIAGETGTGKELVARAIHQASERRDKPFVVVDCGTMNPQLIGSALFGHRRGAFTGAVADTPGAFETADGGTILLDEIGELPVELQPHLLRVLETGEVTPLGNSRPTVVDVRVLAATHRDLKERITSGNFREDLYFRLAVITLRLPALRHRREDIPALIERIAQRAGADPATIPQVALDFMVSHRWPGNVRELHNGVRRVLVLGTLEMDEFDSQKPTPHGAGRGFHEAKKQAIEDFETAYLRSILEVAGGNISKAARAAGIDRKYLRALLKRRGLYKA